MQPRAGFAYDLRGNGRDVIRGGWGLYTDFGFTNSNVLFPAIDVAGGHGQVFFVSNPAGIRKADGSFYTAADPISSIASQNEVDPTLPPVFGQVASPRLEQPYTRQTNLGWAHQLDSATAVTVDYVRVDGRDINIRFRPNTRIDGGARRLADLADPAQHAVVPHGGQQGREHLRRPDPRPAPADVEGLRSERVVHAQRRPQHHRHRQRRARRQQHPGRDAIRSPTCNVGPSSRTDARHRVSLSAIVQAPWGITVAPFFIYRSGLPTLTFEGIDTNNDGNVNDITSRAYRYTGLNDDGTATFEEVGPCENVNCSRRAPFSQLNLRVSQSIRLRGSARIEAIAEVFNLFNAKNPALPITSQRVSAAGVRRRASCSRSRTPATSSSPSSASGSSGSGSRSRAVAAGL